MRLSLILRAAAAPTLVLVASPASATVDPACAVIQSAVKATVGDDATTGPLYPRDVRPSSSPASVRFNPASALQQFDLSPTETSDLLRAWRDQPAEPYVPDCAWEGRPLAIKEDQVVMISEFTRPVFSSDGRLAVFSWGSYSPGRWAHGQTCLARRGQAGWKAVCRPSWLT